MISNYIYKTHSCFKNNIEIKNGISAFLCALFTVARFYNGTMHVGTYIVPATYLYPLPTHQSIVTFFWMQWKTVFVSKTSKICNTYNRIMWPMGIMYYSYMYVYSITDKALILLNKHTLKFRFSPPERFVGNYNWIYALI